MLRRLRQLVREIKDIEFEMSSLFECDVIISQSKESMCLMRKGVLCGVVSIDNDDLTFFKASILTAVEQEEIERKLEKLKEDLQTDWCAIERLGDALVNMEKIQQKIYYPVDMTRKEVFEELDKLEEKKAQFLDELKERTLQLQKIRDRKC